jgi:hypothetical protein
MQRVTIISLFTLITLMTGVSVAQQCPDYSGVGFSVKQQNKLCAALKAAAQGTVKGMYYGEKRDTSIWKDGNPQWIDVGLPANANLLVSFVTVHWWSSANGSLRNEVQRQATVPLGELGGSVDLFGSGAKLCRAVFHVNGRRLELQYRNAGDITLSNNCFDSTGGVALDIEGVFLYQ